MATPRKSSGKRGQKCKTARDGTKTWSRPWMADFLKQAGLTGDVRSALAKSEITLPEYRRARADDAAFDAACVDVDLAVRHSIRQGLELKAADGNVAAAALLSKGLGRLEPDELVDPLPPDVAAAMIEAGIRAAEGGDHYSHGGDFFEPCPHCGRELRVAISGTYSNPSIVLS